MTITLNAFPLHLPDGALIEAREIPFDADVLEKLRQDHRGVHSFYRRGDTILAFSPDGNYPVEGEAVSIDLNDDFRLLCFLFKDGLTRYLKGLGRNPIGFRPIELVSVRADDNILLSIIQGDYPFSIFAKYKLDTRILEDVPNLVIDCSTKSVVNQPCTYFLSQGFDLSGRCIAQERQDGYRKIIGVVACVHGQTIHYQTLDDEPAEINAEDVYLEASRKNFDDYIWFSHPTQADAIIEKIRVAISSFNAGANKRNRINTLHAFLKTKGVKVLNGIQVNIGEAPDIQNKCMQLDKPVFVFNDNGQANWAERGFMQFGPYTKRTFDKNDPSICVICLQQYKGQVEQFVRKFLKGIQGHKYFASGLEGKFGIGTSRVEVFTTEDESVSSYKSVIEKAIQKKSQDGGRWDLAIVQVRQSFKTLRVENNPYYISKSIFFLHQIPVQDFTLELLSQSDASLGYSLNNMALASYAKMGGVPWLLKSSPTLSHELVIGIGSANLQESRGCSKLCVSRVAIRG